MKEFETPDKLMRSHPGAESDSEEEAEEKPGKWNGEEESFIQHTPMEEGQESQEEEPISSYSIVQPICQPFSLSICHPRSCTDPIPLNMAIGSCGIQAQHHISEDCDLHVMTVQ